MSASSPCPSLYQSSLFSATVAFNLAAGPKLMRKQKTTRSCHRIHMVRVSFETYAK